MVAAALATFPAQHLLLPPLPPRTPLPPCSRTCTDVVRKIITGDVDLGIVGLEMLAEIGNDDPGGWVGAGGVLQRGCVGGSGWWQRGGWCRI